MRMSLLCSVAVRRSGHRRRICARRRRVSRHAERPRLAAGGTFIEAPADAPADSRSPANSPPASGSTLSARDGEILRAPDRRVAAVQGPAAAGPFRHQADAGRSFWVLTDNGMGRVNSPDSMLYLNRLKIDWATGKIERQETIFLHDPDKKVPFRIVHEGTAKRYLTGADFDPEGFQTIGDKFWIGDEFGPYLLRPTRTARSRPCSRPRSTASRCARPTIGRCSRRAAAAKLHRRSIAPLQGL